MNPRTTSDTRTFLRERVFGFGDRLDDLGRSPQLAGLRLGFGPDEGQENAFGLRIESYNADPRSLYIEVQGTFGPATAGGEGLAVVEENVLRTYAFLVDRVLPFIARFERREDGSGNGAADGE